MSSPRANVAFALLAALAFHVLLAVALALYLNCAPASDALAELDLTSVDLSFAETVEETSAAVASAPVDAMSSPRPVELAPPPPPIGPAFVPSPIDAVPSPSQMEPKLPSPEEPPELMAPTIVKDESKVERQEVRDARSEEPQDERETAKTPPQRISPVQPASAPRQARVDAPPKPRRAIRPDYPRESRLRGEHGDVSMELDVAADGSVTAVRILKSPGYPLLDAAAVKAARGARFTPAKSGGKPVAATVRLTLNFKLK